MTARCGDAVVAMLTLLRRAVNDVYTPFFLLMVMCVHLLAAPHTKVEESFAMHAAHDVAFGGNDHLVNPPPVRRSAFAPLLLSLISTVPLSTLLRAEPIAPRWILALTVQLSIRLALAVASSLSLASLASACGTRTRRSGAWFVAICASQFHLMFYSCRLLMNTFALVPCTFALAFAARGLSDETRTGNGGTKTTRVSTDSSSSLSAASGDSNALALLLFTCTCIRAELAPAVAMCGVAIFFQHRFRTCLMTIGFALCAIFCAAVVDSAFWETWTLPEAESAAFNVLQGNNKQWGVQPWHFYLTSALPRAVGPALLPAFIGFALEARMRVIGMSMTAFIITLSLIPHKELRFLLPGIPAVNYAAALCLARFCDSEQAGSLFLRSLASLSFAALLLSSCFKLYVSSQNYAGGSAMVALAKHVDSTNATCSGIYIDTALAQEGANRFLEHAFASDCWHFYKEHADGPLSELLPRVQTPIRFALSTYPFVEACKGSEHVVERIHAFGGLNTSALKAAFNERQLPDHVVRWETRAFVLSLTRCELPRRIPSMISSSHFA